MTTHQHIETDGAPIKAWTQGVEVDDKAMEQLRDVAKLPFIYRWVAAMPDIHYGIGATVGSVIPTRKAIIPAAVGVDIGCGMMAVRTTLEASQLPDNLKSVRTGIERAVPHGRTSGRSRDKGSWHDVPDPAGKAWRKLEPRFEAITAKHRRVAKGRTARHLGTLGTGNHFIEVCLDEEQRVWVMLHSGSRGIGNLVGRYFIELAKKDMEDKLGELPHRDLAYFTEGMEHFEDYVEAVEWVQDFAMVNRQLMMAAVLESMRLNREVTGFKAEEMVVNCHHNYVQRERHYGEEVFVTRKGAVSAREGELGIIPGSMGARSFIVRGKGKEESFMSCSHGAGRVMSRTEAKRRYTVEDHVRATEGVECRKDGGVIDETPMAYKDIDRVMEAQGELVEVVHRLKQVVCVKG